MDSVLKLDFELIVNNLDESIYQLAGSKVLLTGSTGMVGAYLLNFLSYLNTCVFDEAVSVICPVRRSVGAEHAMLRNIYQDQHIQWKEMDLAKSFSVTDFVDYIIHAASPASPKHYLQEPFATFDVNVNASRIFLDYAVKNNIRKFLYVSSGEIYGSPNLTDVPTAETYIGTTNHLSERSCYVESKRITETLCMIYYRKYGIPVNIVRPVHVYGPGMKKNDGRVWSDFIEKVMDEKDIDILSDGLASRGFCYIKDAIEQLLTVLLKGENGAVYNIGNDTNISIRELANIIKEKSGKEIQINIHDQVPDYLKGSPQVSCPSITKISELINQDITSIENGIEKTITWYRKNMNV